VAEKLSIQIALDGGAEIERQLADIGAAGQKAFADITKSAEEVGFKNIKPEEVTQKLKEMGVTGVDAIDKIQAAVRSAGQLETLVRGVTTVENGLLALARAAPVIGTVIVTGMAAAAKATIAFADTISKTSDQAVKLGLSFEQFKNLQRDFEKLGVSGKAAADGFGKFQQELQKAAQADPGSQLAAFGQNADVARQQMDRFLQQLRRMPEGLQRTNLAISELGTTAGTQFIQGLRAAEGSMSADERKAYELGQALERLKTSWDALGSVTLAPALSAGIEGLVAVINRANQSFLSFAGTVAAGIANPFELLAQQATAFALTLLGIGPAGEKAGQQAAAGLQLVANPLTGMPELIRQIQPPEASGWTSWAGTVVSAINRVINKFMEWLGLKEKSGGGGGTPREPGGIPMASGGLLGGRGTGTSDSNLAWVSRGEYITPARAVAQPGVLAFLEALRRSGGNLSRVLDGMGRFALGGMIRGPMPAFAGGGLAGGMSNVTIQFPGLPAIGGLRASSDVVDQLHRAAALAQVRSGGRKPSRYS
jgi:hypothetical protein